MKQNSNVKQDSDWTKNSKLQKIAPEKLMLLQSLASQGSQKSPTDLLPFFMSFVTNENQLHLNFSEEEIQLIIDVLKEGKSPAYQRKLERMIRMLKMM